MAFPGSHRLSAAEVEFKQRNLNSKCRVLSTYDSVGNI